MEEKDPSPEYVTGFNRGYIMRKHKADIKFKTVAFNEKDAEQMQGFKDGVIQREKELNYTFDKDRLNPEKFKDAGKDLGPTKY